MTDKSLMRSLWAAVSATLLLTVAEAQDQAEEQASGETTETFWDSKWHFTRLAHLSGSNRLQ